MKIISFIDRFIPEAVHQDYANQSRARIIIAASLLMFTLLLVVLMPQLIMMGNPVAILFMSILTGLLATNVVVMKKRVPFWYQVTFSWLLSMF